MQPPARKYCQLVRSERHLRRCSAVLLICQRWMLACSAIIALSGSTAVCQEQDSGAVMVATFDVDVTPPVGVYMAYDPVKRVDELTLRSRGVIIRSDDAPIVLCAVDFIGIANEAHDAWRESIAIAAETTIDRVAVHVLHQHDAPRVDYTAEQILRDAQVSNAGFRHLTGE